MHIQSRLLPLALTALLTAVPVLGAGPRGPHPQPVAADLDSTEAAALLFMREEERLARDVYLVMDDLYQALPFANIARSEQKHMDTVKKMLDKYRLDDPSNPAEIGIFANPELQSLYTTLIDQGDDSLIAALQVGALIEEVDIEDLENAIAATDNLDLQRMYANLLRGSRNHLRAFVAEIERQGEVYAAQHLDQVAVDAIVDTPMERGGNDAGQSNGRDNRLGMTDTGAERFLERGVNGSGKGQGAGQGQGKSKGKGTGQSVNQESRC